MAQASDSALTGTVVDTFDGGGYTYIQLDTGTETKWTAIGQAPVTVGEQVSLKPGPVMRDFHSRTLDRTFPEIIFSSGLIGADEAAASTSFGGALQGEGMGMMSPMAGLEQASGGSATAVAPLQEVAIEKVEGENGYTIEEIFTQAADLSGKKVKIRGKAVKVSANIMGKNWIHLQDGTGNPANNSHDLVITSADMPETNSIIVIEGVIATDKDFGAGYKYNVILEEAVVSN
ncbi:MAG: DNA-binding protein [Desulfobulbaceae bacterium]|uniref:DNA-binding protein n=1 Tax=Candidatus Desulfobia pelagia TaxID=2841692 RepID=A0A8J6NDI5_9BACT|nr:DNA-binding protein [Candidatus Desulfobia pelagia]